MLFNNLRATLFCLLFSVLCLPSCGGGGGDPDDPGNSSDPSNEDREVCFEICETWGDCNSPGCAPSRECFGDCMGQCLQVVQVGCLEHCENSNHVCMVMGSDDLQLDCNALCQWRLNHGGEEEGEEGDDQCPPGGPSDEICDGLDNDCNGTVDDRYLHSQNCDPIARTGCPTPDGITPGGTCYLFHVDGNPVGRCWCAEGSGRSCDPCDTQSDCAPGYTCLEELWPSVCTRVCDEPLLNKSYCGGEFCAIGSDEEWGHCDAAHCFE